MSRLIAIRRRGRRLGTSIHTLAFIVVRGRERQLSDPIRTSRLIAMRRRGRRLGTSIRTPVFIVMRGGRKR
ncbi:MAG: hypothetical protein WDN30_00760 [Pararobbsia sp.]